MVQRRICFSVLWMSGAFMNPFLLSFFLSPHLSHFTLDAVPSAFRRAGEHDQIERQSLYYCGFKTHTQDSFRCFLHDHHYPILAFSR